MKQLKMLALLFAAILLTFSACKKDDDEDPGTVVEISNIELSSDNTTLTITFNQGVYKNADQTGNIDAGSFALTFVAANPVAASFTAQHTAGENKAIITITYENRTDGDEMLDVTVKANTVYGEAGNAVTEDLMESLDVNDLGIIGKWSAYDISAILASLGYDDSLYANFYADQSYMVTAFVGGASATFVGVYEMEKTQFDNIWEIALNQTELNGQPTEILSEGIFKVYPAAQDSMWYEVAQVDPAIAGVTPPTAAAGFGSTSAGAFGTMNIQKYHWIGQE